MATEIGKNIAARISKAGEKLNGDIAGSETKRLAAILYFAADADEILKMIEDSSGALDAEDHALLDSSVPALQRSAAKLKQIAEKIGVEVGRDISQRRVMSDVSFAELFEAIGDIIDALVSLAAGEIDFGEAGYQIGDAVDRIADQIGNILDGPG